MKTVARIGYWSALGAFLAAAGYSVVQILQVIGVLTFPVDEISIFAFSILIPVPFVISLVSLHHTLPEEKRIWSHIAIMLGVMYAVLVSIVYPTQLALVIPARLTGKGDSVQFLMVSKGTFMWVMDGAGYILMGLATLFAAGSFIGNSSQRWLRWFLIANGLLDPLIIAIYIFPGLILFGSLWIVTAPGSMLLLARYFHLIADDFADNGAGER